MLLSAPEAAHSSGEYFYLHELLKTAKKNPKEKVPYERIYMKDDILYCTGESKAALTNNRAAELMKQEKYREAIDILKEGLKHSALFFPFRYNIGVCHLYLFDLKRAMLHFRKAVQIVPEYSKTYLQMGYIYQKWDMDSRAVEQFREALRRNNKEIETFILIGNVYFKRHQLEMARKYYSASLDVKPLYPNGLLGRAKIYFIRGKYHRAMVLIKSIDISKGEYDKALHYYYAECAFKLKDYKTAADEYAKLLTFRRDRFFLTNSPALIEHKLDISKRFIGR